jgi:hypothetical protein
MTDKMIPLQGYFKIDTLDKNGKITSTYEDKNTIMARVPELLAGQISGMYKKDIAKNIICTLAIGTGGVKDDSLGNKIPKTVRDDRTELFAEEAFWDMSSTTPPSPQTEESRVYQQSFTTTAHGDLNKNMAIFYDLDLQTNGSTIPFDPATGYPLNYLTKPSVNEDENIVGEFMNRGREIKYIFTVGQFAANDISNTAIPYSEAGLYLQFDSHPNLLDGINAPHQASTNPLGQLFSMKTFPIVYKDSSCSIDFTWRLYF